MSEFDDISCLDWNATIPTVSPILKPEGEAKLLEEEAKALREELNHSRLTRGNAIRTPTPTLSTVARRGYEIKRTAQRIKGKENQLWRYTPSNL